MSVPAYPDYKDSGVAWLGAVPSHWDTCALKRVTTLRSGEAITSDSIEVVGDYPVFGGNGHRGYASSYTHDGYFALIGRQGALCGNINYASGRFWASEHAIVAAPAKPLETRWLGELLRAMNLNQYSVAAAQPGLSADALGNLRIPFPPFEEQAAIAAFLDRETAKIDGLVAEQERLIALLKEKRAAVISHAVTKGLNPNAPMKDSGIEWLGEIPAHWEVGPVKRFFEFLDGKRVPLSAEERGGMQGDYPYYGASGIIDYVYDYIFDEPLVLVSEDGANLLMRNYRIAFVADGKYWVNNHAHILKPLDGLVSFWADRIEAVDLTPIITGSAQPKLTADALEKLRLAVPPTVEERRDIEAFVLSATAKFAPLENEAQSAITLLQERRAALISAAVTGKIDVRGLVETPAELEPA